MRLNKTVSLLILAIQLLPLQSSAQIQPWRQQLSPKKDIIIQYIRNDSLEHHEIWLVERADSTDRSFLYSYNREADVQFSPNQQLLVLKDFVGSNLSELRLFERTTGIRFSEIKKANIAGKGWQLLAMTKHLSKPPSFFHVYANFVCWSENSESFLFSIYGHDDLSHYLDPWFAVFDVKTLQATLNLQDLNRGALHY